MAVPRPPPSLKALCLAPVALCFGVAVACAFLLEAQLVPLLLLVLGLALALNVTRPGARGFEAALQQGAYDGAATAAAQPLALPFCLLAAGIGAITGVYAHETFAISFYAAALGRGYSGVLASSPGGAYIDAGRLRFAGTSTVDSSRALGYKNRHTFCVAPVVDSGPQQARKISFWAVGLNCCGERASFECGGAGAVGAQAAVRAPPDSLFRRSHSDFMPAIRQAAAVYDLAVDEDPILLHWADDPSSPQWAAFLYTLGVIGLGTALFSILEAAMLALALRGRGRVGGWAGNTAAFTAAALPK